jgi:nitroimidazol reductase NimA-like FMN-containing flavoprotein (pyridoxamine 5'-phosphate oxidase superfamily)
MSGDRELSALAREIIDANRYMTLATADGRGRAWASPVWYAHEGYTEFLWASRPDARHSRNIAARPELGIVIFDSTAAEGDAQAVYLEASAEELTGADRDQAIATYSRRSETQGAGAWTTTDVTAPAAHRLYRATASAHFLLGANDRRISLELDREDRP